MSSDAGYRRELEEELERLTRELADVRVEKAQQRQRVEQLQLEQFQLKDQLGQKAAGDKELRTDLAQELHTLHQIVRNKKQEHGKVKTEWEKSQEQYNQLKQTVDLLQEQGGAGADNNYLHEDDDDDDESLANDSSTPNKGALSKQEEKSFMDNLAEEVAGGGCESMDGSSVWGEGSTLDGNSVITEHTKDSLAIHRQNQAARAGGETHLGRFFSRQHGDVVPGSSSINSNSIGAGRPPSGGGALGSFFEKEGKKKPGKREDDKDLKSANE